MAIWNRQEKEAYRAESPTKHGYDATVNANFHEGEVGAVEDQDVALERGLKARHITMIGMHARIGEETSVPEKGVTYWRILNYRGLWLTFVRL
jgi:amino acid permease